MRMMFLIVFAASIFTSAVDARGYRAPRPYYGGGHHTTSHGGNYMGAYGGSSHKGGHYSNAMTASRYGRHR